ATGPRSTLPRWADWADWGAADLDPRPAVSSACPLSGAGCCAGRGWGAPPAAQSSLLGRGQAVGDSVSGKAPGCVAIDGPLPAHPTPNLAAALGGGLPAGWEWRRSAEVSSALDLPGCALEQPHRRHPRRPRDISLARWRHQADADLYTTGPGLHWAVC